MNARGDLGGRLALAHVDEPAFAQAAEPGFLAAGELARAGFDSVNASGTREEESKRGGEGESVAFLNP
jgi:hypothetical protein